MTQQKTRLVLDTNTLVSAFKNETSWSASFFRFVQRNYDLLVSSETLDEFDITLLKPKIEKFFIGREQRRDELVLEYITSSILTQITITSTDCRDPKDNKFLSLALSGGADFIISGDKDLTVLNPYHGIKILTMREFVDENGIILETERCPIGCDHIPSKETEAYLLLPDEEKGYTTFSNFEAWKNSLDDEENPKK